MFAGSRQECNYANIIVFIQGPNLTSVMCVGVRSEREARYGNTYAYTQVPCPSPASTVARLSASKVFSL